MESVDIKDPPVANVEDEAPKSCREKIRPFFRHKRFHQVILLLIIVDALIVLLALLIDLDVIPVTGDTPEDAEHYKEEIEDALHYTSITVLSIFVVEISVKIYIERLDFLHDHLEVFDAFIVITSFILDVALTILPVSRAVNDIVALMIIFRLWRFVKLISYINICVRKEVHMKLEDESKARHKAEDEVQELKKQIEDLQSHQHPSETKVDIYT